MSVPGMLSRRTKAGSALSSVVLILVFVAAGVASDNAVRSSGSAAEPGAFAEADNALKAFERLATSGERFYPAPFGNPEKSAGTVERIRRATEAVDAYLAEHPADPRAMLLKARLLRALDMTSPASFSSEPNGKPQISGSRYTGEILRLLDAVLEKEPRNADAHYRKAQVLSTQELTFVDNTIGYKPPETEKIIHHASQAYALAPGNSAYCEFYAQILVATDRADEAIRIMKDVDGGNHPMYRLMIDWRVIPIPDNAMYDAGMTGTFIEMAAAADDRPEYPQFRFASFVVHRPAADVEAFYRAKWSGFKLVPRSSGAPGDSMRSYAAFLEWKGDVLVPSEGVSDADEKKSGVMLMLMEYPKPDAKDREMYNVPENTPLTHLVITNVRRFKTAK